MLNELALGIAVNIAAMFVHLGATMLLVTLIHPYGGWMGDSPRPRLMFAMLTTTTVLLAAHLIEVGLWATIYVVLARATDIDNAYYAALLNYTTLGYGDALHGTTTRLLGPLAAASGIMMFGWSTALLIYVLQGHLPRIVPPKRRDE